jgi:hypothetical protein
MGDDLNKKGQPDRDRINMNEPHEVQYWTEALGVTKAELEAAVQAAGVMADDVRKYLRR